jgi:hypothetical protein
MRALVVTVLLAGIPGCSGSSGSDAGPPAGEGAVAGDSSKGKGNPCPEEGLGVKSSSGTSCSSVVDPNDPDVIDCANQMTNYKDYACSEPQICPDQGVVSIPGFVLGSSAQSVTFTITNCSTGTRKLRVARVDLEGDPRCSFQLDPNTPAEIAPGESATVKADYAPQVEGEDHAAIVVYSDAQNFPGLMLPLCGRAVTSGGSPGSLTCKMVSGVEPCHR